MAGTIQRLISGKTDVKKQVVIW